MSGKNHAQMTLDEFKRLPVMASEEVAEFAKFVILPRDDHEESAPDYMLMDLVLVDEKENAICRVRCDSDMFILGGLPRFIDGKAHHYNSEPVSWYAHILDRSGLVSMFCGSPLTCRGVGGFGGTCLSYEILPKEER